MLSAAKANREYFRNAYHTGEHGWAVEGPSPYAVKFLNRLKRIIPDGRLLDIGCGEGRHAILAARLGFKVTAVDYEPLALKRAQRFAKAEGAKGIAFRIANVLCLPPPKKGYDIVLDYGCLHHQKKSDWLAYKTSILRVLSPKGFFILSVFSPTFPLLRGSRQSWHIAQGAYRRSFTRHDISDLFSREFEVLEMIEENGGRHGFWHVLFRRRTKLNEINSNPKCMKRLNKIASILSKRMAAYRTR
jgi:2-polyprenyl-3-methyl-5-hydroxy-6-metoxy-1,4-benzoquinol methylase